MYCDKCKDKNIKRINVVEIKCKVCGKKFKTRFTNICYNCQIKGHCIVCGELIKSDKNKK